MDKMHKFSAVCKNFFQNKNENIYLNNFRNILNLDKTDLVTRLLINTSTLESVL